jgi:hypothetical protein
MPPHRQEMRSDFTLRTEVRQRYGRVIQQYLPQTTYCALGILCLSKSRTREEH